MQSTLTLNAQSTVKQFPIGSYLVLQEPENRWWVHFWYWLTFRSVPTRSVRYQVVEHNETTLTIVKPEYLP